MRRAHACTLTAFLVATGAVYVLVAFRYETVPPGIPQLRLAAQQGPETREVTPTPPAARPAPPRCRFDGCPLTNDTVYLYTMTAHRNRADALERMVRTLAVDAQSGVAAIDPRCVCVTVADYDDKVVGPPVSAALESWPFSHCVVPVRGHFSRAGGLQALLQHVISTPPERSVAYFLDADMVAYPGMLSCVLSNVQRGQSAFAPVSWSTVNKTTTEGAWRITGTGMLAFFVSDMLLISNGSLPMADKLSYGKEDAALTDLLQRARPGYKVVRRCCPQLWHLWHPKTHWQSSYDGQVPRRVVGEPTAWSPEVAWRLPDPPANASAALIAAGQLSAYRCKRALQGKMY